MSAVQSTFAAVGLGALDEFVLHRTQDWHFGKSLEESPSPRVCPSILVIVLL